ncbi:MAG: Group II intron-encoded protein LtrA [Actinobacteria bacterium]|nr:Group II intron-encoded protein LtrA [Actinomycetota bacterium]
MRNKVRELQRSLYRAAKADPERCFHSLYDKVYRSDVLWEAWKRVKANGGVPGNDGESIEDIIEYGEVRYLKELQQELKEGRYRTKSIRRMYIPKPDGKKRPLGIPCVRDRVVQTAVKTVLEPIFESKFLDCSFGFRPKRSARQASQRIRKYLNFGHTWVLDVDLSSYFDTLPHDRLLKLIGQYVVDRNILKMLQAWLKAKVVDRGEVLNPEEGSPQGGVISPLLANLYLHQFDEEWHKRHNHRRWRYDAVLTRYADDLILLAPSEDEGIWREVVNILEGLGLVVNQQKTGFYHAREGFDYLGYHFVRSYSRRHQKDVTYVIPTKKSRKRVWDKIRWYTDKRRYQNLPVEWIVEKLNPILLGWTNYYAHTNSHRIFRKLQAYTNSRLRKALRYRRKKEGVGRYRDLPNHILYKRYELACIGMGRIEYCWS